jgi:4-amino-4-deoxy-L-arabinose transferase-like glycosyltransferase
MEYLRKLIKERYFYLVLIVALAVFFRFYQLGNIPSGLTNDEAGVGYDAYSTLLTGRDQWNQFMPIHFMAFGDFPLPVLRYLTTLSVYFFDLNSFSVRLPSAVFGLLSVVLIFFLARKLFDEKVALCSSLLLAISPWAIGLSRVTIEPNIAITIFLSGLLVYLSSKNRKYLLFLSILLFSILIYTYSAYTLFFPLAALVLIIWNRKNIAKNLKKYGIAFLLLILLMLPNFLIKNTAASVRFSQVGLVSNISSIGLVNTLNDERGACLKDFKGIICRSADNKIILFASTFFKNYLSHFNFGFLYGNGNTTQYSILPDRGLEYLFEAAFFILGVGFILKNKDRRGYLALALLLISPIPDSLTGVGHYGRASIMLPFLILVEGVGFFYLIKSIGKIKYSLFKKLTYLVLVMAIFAATLIFWLNYLTYFKNNYSVYSQYGYEELMKNVATVTKNYDKIYVSKNLNDAKQYAYYLFYNKYNPRKFQNKINVSYRTDSSGWISIDKIDNIYFVQTLPLITDKLIRPEEKILFISAPVDFPKNIKSEFTVKDKIGNILFKAVSLSDLLKYNKGNIAFPLM